MNQNSILDRRAAAWLADGPTELADRVLEAALNEVHLTKQRRVLRVSWRFLRMPALSRATGIAAVALVALIGAGTLIYLNHSAPGGPGGPGEPTDPPTATASPAAAVTTAPTIAPTIPPTTGWQTYLSETYGFSISFPDDWTVVAQAERPWQPGDGQIQDAPNAELFASPGSDTIGMSALKMPVGTWGDVGTDDGLVAWAQAFCDDDGNAWCSEVPERAQVICIKPQNSDGTCPRRALLLPTANVQYAFTPESFTSGVSRVIVVIVGRPDDFVSTRQYGGSVQLLRAVMTTIVG